MSRLWWGSFSLLFVWHKNVIRLLFNNFYFVVRKRSSMVGQPVPSPGFRFSLWIPKRLPSRGYLAGFMGPQLPAGALKRFDKHIRCLGSGLGRGLDASSYDPFSLALALVGCNLLCFINIFDETLPLLLPPDILWVLCCLLCGFWALIIRPVGGRFSYFVCLYYVNSFLRAKCL